MKSFSFIIPVYNCADYLSACVEGILAIGLSKFEIILVNDGSKDESGNICDDFSRKFQNIITVHQKNQGVSVARNRGIDEASGDYIIFLDADDSVESEKFSKILKIIENDDSIDMLEFGLIFDYYYHGKVYRSDNKLYHIDGVMNAEQWCEVFYELYVNNMISPMWNKVFKRKIITEHNLKLNQNMFLYEDLEFVIRYMTYCDKIYNSTEMVYHYRQAEDEGNAKRRLARIDSLSEFILQIEHPLDNMISVLNCDEKTELSIKSILSLLYLVLAREKIGISNRKQMQRICFDMAKWLEHQDKRIVQNLSQSEKEYLNLILNCRIDKIILKRKISSIRHSIAVRVKNTGIYKKLKG